MTSLTAIDLLLALVVAILGALVADRLLESSRAIPLGLLLGALLGLVIAQTLVKSVMVDAGSRGAGPSDASSSSSTSATPSQTATPTATTTPTGTATPTVTTTPTARQTQPTAEPRPTTASKESVDYWLVDATTSDESEAQPVPGKVLSRFWHYEGTFGDVVMKGTYATAPETRGRDCGNPYVRYLVDGLPEGTYNLQTYVPDVDSLAGQVVFGAKAFDQSAFRDQWVDLGSASTTVSLPGSQSIEVSASQSFSGDDPQGCEKTGRRVAFGPVRFTPVE